MSRLREGPPLLTPPLLSPPSRTANTTTASWAFKNVVAGMLKKDPTERMGWEDVVRHEFWEERTDKNEDSAANRTTLMYCMTL